MTNYFYILGRYKNKGGRFQLVVMDGETPTLIPNSKANRSKTGAHAQGKAAAILWDLLTDYPDMELKIEQAYYYEI